MQRFSLAINNSAVTEIRVEDGAAVSIDLSSYQQRSLSSRFDVA